MIVAGIPAFNEEKTIAKVILLAQRYADVVVVCDDGSQDLTAEISQRLGAIVIRHEKNIGYGAAIQELFKKAKALDADLLLTLDADGQHDPKEIGALLEPILKDEADIVIGSRFLKDSQTKIPAYRRFGIKLINALSAKTEEGNLSDAQSGFRAYNKKATQSLRLIESGMGLSAEVLLKAKGNGLRIKEVPISCRYEGLETSTQHPVSQGLSVVSSIIRIVVEERPLVFLGVPGVIILSAGVLLGLWMLEIYVANRYIETNLALAAIAFVLVGAFCLFTAITLYAILRLAQKQKT
jgi:glycosyltransferase involved in cell wall biosynthesis